MTSILRVAVLTPLQALFDYFLPEDFETPKVGARVRVPFGRRKLVGIVVELAGHTDFDKKKIKPIEAVLDEEPVISRPIFDLCLWASDYYHHALGEVFANAIPSLLRKGKSAAFSKRQSNLAIADGKPASLCRLNSGQKCALDAVLSAKEQFKVFLLDGVTGSGKTEVYLRVIDAMLNIGKSALVLVPEISLTPQTVRRFKARFNVPVICLHSSLTDRQRLDAWLLAQKGKAQIVIGTRSAVFTPMLQLGVVIVDEEHDLSFKQQDHFRYNARDLAIMRANKAGVPVVLGSATPSLESLYNVQQSRYTHLHLKERAGSAILPHYKLLDIRDVKLTYGLSKRLLAVIEKHLTQNNQVLVFLNRRGFAPALICHRCGFTVLCHRCDVRMTYHKASERLVCHHCGAVRPVITVCPECGGQTLKDVGVGTERLEQGLQKYFKDTPVVRIDRDTTKTKDSLPALLDKVHEGGSMILVGTQMIAKGHHFPNVTLVCIVDLDGGFFSADFRAVEKTAQLLIQVSGRAGRAEKPGEVMIQTHFPDHPLLFTLIQKDYAAFAANVLKEREETSLPPYSYCALMRSEALDKRMAEDFLKQVKALCTKIPIGMNVFGPIASPLARRKNHFRFHLLFQSMARKPLHIVLKQVLNQIPQLKLSRKVRFSLDVDPQEMI